jgi:uncharacterized protein (DUF885 family)
VRWLSILVLALTLVAAGCGGDDDSSASDDTTIEETLTEDTTTDETTGDETTDLSGVLEDEDCRALASAGSAFAQAFTGTSSAEDAEAFQELADSVPDEIKADVQVLAEAFATYSEELQDIGLEAGGTPTAEQLQQLQAALASIDQAEVTAASERLGAWAQENCTG